MDIYGGAERLMGMKDADWHRHANPWSVWTRFSCLPLIILAIWSRVWLGWWALAPVALSLLWTWANPRVFPPPADFGSWASRVTLGERIFLNRKAYSVAPHHRRAANVLTALSVVGLGPLVYGLVALNVWVTLTGMVLVVLPKIWFCDRMVWLHAEFTGTEPGTSLPDPRMPQGSQDDQH